MTIDCIVLGAGIVGVAGVGGNVEHETEELKEVVFFDVEGAVAAVVGFAA